MPFLRTRKDFPKNLRDSLLLVLRLPLSKDNVYSTSRDSGAGEGPVGVELIASMFVVGAKDPLDEMGAGESVTLRGVLAGAGDAQLLPVIFIFKVFGETGVRVEVAEPRLLVSPQLGKRAKFVVLVQGSLPVILAVGVEGLKNFVGSGHFFVLAHIGAIEMVADFFGRTPRRLGLTRRLVSW